MRRRSTTLFEKAGAAWNREPNDVKCEYETKRARAAGDTAGRSALTPQTPSREKNPCISMWPFSQVDALPLSLPLSLASATLSFFETHNAAPDRHGASSATRHRAALLGRLRRPAKTRKEGERAAARALGQPTIHQRQPLSDIQRRQQQRDTSSTAPDAKYIRRKPLALIKGGKFLSRPMRLF